MTEVYTVKTREVPDEFEGSPFESVTLMAGNGVNALAKKVVRGPHVLGRSLFQNERVKGAVKGRRPSKGDFWWNQVRELDPTVDTIYCVGFKPSEVKVWVYEKIDGQWAGLQDGHIGDGGHLKEITLTELDVNSKAPSYILTTEDMAIIEE